MPNPNNDKDQHRFAQIRGRMLDGVAKNLPDYFVEASGAKDRADLRIKIMESESILNIIDCCAYEAQCIEEEEGRRGRNS